MLLDRFVAAGRNGKVAEHLLMCQATTQLNTQFYKDARCIPALYEIAATSQNQAVSLT
jgi:hypothetical protein